MREAFRRSPGHAFAIGCLAGLTLLVLVLLLLSHPYALKDQPLPDAREYLNASYQLAHGHGYTTTVRDNSFSHHARQALYPPRYPPGTSLILAPFALLGTYPGNVEFGSRVIVVALVLVAGWAGYMLRGWYAALLASLVVAVSPFVLVNSHIVMSDALGALLVVVCVPLMMLKTKWSGYVLGLVAGYGVVCRESGIIVVACLLIVLQHKERLRVAVGAAGPIVGVALYNWSTFGGPWKTGYGYWLGAFSEYSASYITKHPWPPGADGYYSSSLQLFDLVRQSHAGFIGPLPNLLFYPLILLGFSAVFGPPLLTLVGLVTAIRSWNRSEARFTLLVAGTSVVFYMANYTQDPRFLAGPCILLTVWGIVGLVLLARSLWERFEVELRAQRPRAASGA